MNLRTEGGKIIFSFVENITTFGDKETRKIRDFTGKPLADYLLHFTENRLFMKVLMLNIMDMDSKESRFFLAPNVLQIFMCRGYDAVLKSGGKTIRLIVRDKKGKRYVFQSDMLAKSENIGKVDIEVRSRLDLEKVNTEFNFARNMKYSTTVLDGKGVKETELKCPYEGVAVSKDGTLVFKKKSQKKSGK